MSDAALSVALDATPVISGRTGIARYVTQLGVALERRGVDVHRFAIGRAPVQPPPDVRHVPVPLRLVERWWQMVPRPSIERLVGGVDVVHAAGPIVPPARSPLVVSVYDLAPLDHPELHPRRHARQLRALVNELDRAAAVLAISCATADELVARGVDRAKVFVTRLGATPLPEQAPTAVAGASSLPEPGSYFLAVGETSPRKGYTTLLRALAQLGSVSPRLVMVGPAAGDEARIRDMITALGLGSRVVRLGVVSDDVLARLYRGAVALCFPSVAEGFGLPVLEALATGVPVVASDIPVVREVAGDTALLVPLGNEVDLAEALRALSSDRLLRSQLSVGGRKRAAGFSWDDTAERTIAAYQTALPAAHG